MYLGSLVLHILLSVGFMFDSLSISIVSSVLIE